MALPNILEALERTVYEAFRLNLVKEGYIPDIMDYDVENGDLAIARAAQEDYKTAVTNIANSSKGFAIDLFSNSVSQQRGTLRSPRIVLNSEGFYPGEIGLDTTTQYKKNTLGTYDKIYSTSETSDFYFNVRLVANNTKQLRVLHGVNAVTLPRRGYLKWYDKDFMNSGNLFFKFISYSQNEFDEEGITVKIYRYLIPDAHEISDTLIGTAPPIVQIDYNDETII